MYKNSGVTNEENFVQNLNNKKIADLNPNLQTLIKRIYGPVDENKTIKCKLVENFQKPDICIEYCEIKKYVSLKSGHANGVHEEQIKTLIPFFKDSGMDEDDIKLFLKLFYRDGTIDGSGEKALDYITSRFEYQDEIELFNERVNGNKRLVEKIVNHCLFEGSKSNYLHAEYIYFGTVKFGVLCSREQINKHISRRTWGYMDNPHIGPLQFRAHYFRETNDPQEKQRRHQCDFWWARLREDLEYIEERYWG